MAHILHQVVEEPHECSYLPSESAQLEVMVLQGVAAFELEALLERGWRHFGAAFFRPACIDCFECITLRVLAQEFEPSAGQKRAMRVAASRFRREVGMPRVDAERLALYSKWHASREQARGWEPSVYSRDSYARDFATPHSCAREVAYYDDFAGGKLVGLGLWDELSHGKSAIYFFYDPDIRGVSLGVANVVAGIDDARRAGQPYVYLGYWVGKCDSLRYKSHYLPHELLVGRPGLAEKPTWIRATSPSFGKP